uniref:S100/CaBP-9k-type calcium binding subdomain domain-containing protein n=1 Tax=Leptobrachium leishanense TaxID=445787 RepID=A0A8C5LTV0_9ANUR
MTHTCFINHVSARLYITPAFTPRVARSLKMSAPKMTELETAFCTIIDVFDKYSSAEGNNMTLSKGKMKMLMEKELPLLLSSAKKKGASKKLLKDLFGDREVLLKLDDFLEILAKVIVSHGPKRFENVSPK